MARVKPIVDTALEDFRRMQQVNVEGVFLGAMRTYWTQVAEDAFRCADGATLSDLPATPKESNPT